MRISDWSSDVCSSDLASGTACQSQDDGQRDTPRSLHAGSSSFNVSRCISRSTRGEISITPTPTETAVQPTVLKTESTVSLPPVSPSKIGRTSCRERVYQYL